MQKQRIHSRRNNLFAVKLNVGDPEETFTKKNSVCAND